MSTYFKYYEENPYVDEYNHSYSHAANHYQRFYSNPHTATLDIVRNQELLKLPFKIVRLPGRNIWRENGRQRNDGVSGASTADSLVSRGYKVFGWDLEWEHHPDGKPIQSASQMLEEIHAICNNRNSFTPGNVVVLMHDEMFQQSWEKSELKQLIDLLKTNPAYRFEQLRFYPQ